MVGDIHITSLPIYLNVVRQGASSNGRTASDKCEITRCSVYVMARISFVPALMT